MGHDSGNMDDSTDPIAWELGSAGSESEEGLTRWSAQEEEGWDGFGVSKP